MLNKIPFNLMKDEFINNGPKYYNWYEIKEANTGKQYLLITRSGIAYASQLAHEIFDLPWQVKFDTSSNHLTEVVQFLTEHDKPIIIEGFTINKISFGNAETNAEYWNILDSCIKIPAPDGDFGYEFDKIALVDTNKNMYADIKSSQLIEINSQVQAQNKIDSTTIYTIVVNASDNPLVPTSFTSQAEALMYADQLADIYMCPVYVFKRRLNQKIRSFIHESSDEKPIIIIDKRKDNEEI